MCTQVRVQMLRCAILLSMSWIRHFVWHASVKRIHTCTYEAFQAKPQAPFNLSAYAQLDSREHSGLAQDFLAMPHIASRTQWYASFCSSDTLVQHSTPLFCSSPLPSPMQGVGEGGGRSAETSGWTEVGVLSLCFLRWLLQFASWTSQPWVHFQSVWHPCCVLLQCSTRPKTPVCYIYAEISSTHSIHLRWVKDAHIDSCENIIVETCFRTVKGPHACPHV